MKIDRHRIRHFLAYLLLAGIIVLLDQASKQFALAQLAGRPPVDVLPFLQFVLVFNRGAAFGMLGDAGGWQQIVFIVVAIVVACALLGWLWRAHRNPFLATALALLLGGAIGNLIDRASYQFVIDFISLHYGGWRFPAFNIADAAITFGAAGMVIDNFDRRTRR